MKQILNPGLPAIGEYNQNFKSYIDAVGEANPIELLRTDFRKQLDLLDGSPGLRMEYAYNHGKWTLRQLMIHLIDTERVMNFRLLAALRMDPNNYPGYDYLHFADQTTSDVRQWVEIREEWKNVRKAFVSLASQVPSDYWSRYCVVDGQMLSARALVYIVPGHARVHFKTIQSRYLP